MKGSYNGRDRRRHRMYVTRNTEYLFRDERCIAVRDRATGNWLPAHLAVNRTVSGGVRFQPNGTAVPSFDGPQVGEALYFGEHGRELVTSLLCAIERPQKELVVSYPRADSATG